jgi:arabinofuranosyltransferase
LAVQTAFSTIYFGNPLPNTFLAKMGGAVEGTMENGFLYLMESLTRDPAAAVITLTALTLARPQLPKVATATAAATLLYMLFILKSSDYMLGRFLLPPLALLIALTTMCRIPAVTSQIISAVLVATLLRGPHIHRDWAKVSTERIKDCTMNQYDVVSGKYLNKHDWFRTGSMLPEGAVSTHGSIGIIGYAAPNSHHIVDLLALSDPVLARLPGRVFPVSRPGHADRFVPVNYQEAVQKKDWRLVRDPTIQKLLKLHWTIQREPFLSRKRLGAMWGFFTMEVPPETVFNQKFPEPKIYNNGLEYLEGAQGTIVRPRGKGRLALSLPDECIITYLTENKEVLITTKARGVGHIETAGGEIIHIRPGQPSEGKGCAIQWIGTEE